MALTLDIRAVQISLEKFAARLQREVDNAVQVGLAQSTRALADVTPMGAPDKRDPQHMAEQYAVVTLGEHYYGIAQDSAHADPVIFGAGPHAIPHAFGYPFPFGTNPDFHPGNAPNQAINQALDEEEGRLTRLLGIAVDRVVAAWR